MDLKILKVLTLSTIIFLTAFSASADDQLAASVGLKGWYVIDWSNKYSIGTSDYKLESKDPVFMIGPSVKISYGNFFTGLNFLTTLSDSAFDMELDGTLVGKGDRQDVDFVIGYAPISWLSVIGGYKVIDADVAREYGSTVAIAINGPAVGISLNYLIPRTPVLVYANAAYMYLRGQAWLETVWANAYSYEAGVTYSPVNHLVLSIGYKGQTINYSTDIAGEENMWGITFAFDYRF